MTVHHSADSMTNGGPPPFLELCELGYPYWHALDLGLWLWHCCEGVLGSGGVWADGWLDVSVWMHSSRGWEISPLQHLQ